MNNSGAQDVFYNIILPPLIDEMIDKCEFKTLCNWKMISTRCWKIIQERYRESFKRIFVPNTLLMCNSKKTSKVFQEITRVFLEEPTIKIIIFKMDRRHGNTFLLQHFATRFQGHVYVWTTGQRTFHDFKQGVNGSRTPVRCFNQDEFYNDIPSLVLIDAGVDLTYLVPNILNYPVCFPNTRCIVAAGTNSHAHWSDYKNVFYIDGTKI